MSATTTTTVKTSTVPSGAVPMRNPRDSMKSTWRKDKSTWGPFHWLFDATKMYATDITRETPVHQKTEKVPNVPAWQLHVWVWAMALPPMILHHLYVTYLGKNLDYLPAYAFYYFAFQIGGIVQIQQMCRLGHAYGFLDGDKHARDEIPDHSVSKVFWALFFTPVFRVAAAVLLAYRSNLPPSSINWKILPVEIGLYGIILDFWFYWYHRIMHQFDSMWKYHRTHHLTKHPNPLLTLYADHEQEVFDILGVPLLAYGTMKLMGLPMGFYEWWICQNYVVFTELAGHSGLRINATPPSTLSWLLVYFDADLGIEDHDLHHRTGWKKSHNYGKQTRLWDRIFGTCVDRIETKHENIDYENTASIFVDLFPWTRSTRK